MSDVMSARNRLALEKRRRLLVGFLLAGYPSRDGFIEAVIQSAAAGLDILEVGFPSQNPANDGHVIKEANRLADLSIWDDMAYWERIRKAVDVPLWVMGYNAELLDTPRYLNLAKAGVVDALVLPNLSLTQRTALAEQLAPYGCDVLGFVNPETPLEDAKTCFAEAPLVYMQLYVGQTGKKVERDTFGPLLKLSQEIGRTNLFAGFGIDTPQRVRYLLDQGFAGAIVGTAMVSHQNESLQNLLQFIQTMKAATDQEDMK